MSTLARLLSQARESRAFSGAAYILGRHDAILDRGTVGTLSWDGDPVSDASLWDLASLTKPIAALGAMVLLERGCLRLDDGVGHFLPDFACTDKSRLTIRQLLTHTSGIPGQQPLFWGVRNKAEMLAAVSHLPLRFEAGRNVEYTSQGFMVLGEIIESVAGQSLESLLQEAVFAPVGMENTIFNPGPELRGRAAATEFCTWRGWMVQGEVHDENAAVMGGIAAHAGLFSTAHDLARLCQAMLAEGAGKYGRLLSPETVACMTQAATGDLMLARALGWQARDRIGSPGGDLFTDRSYGHTGFTGTSVWMDPTLDLFVVLLTNRVHPTRQNEAIHRLRPLFHNAAVAGWGARGAANPGQETGRT